MCFMLYAGTDRAIPRRAFDRSAPDVSVQDLDASEEQVRTHFRKPEVQNIGSTSNCGCDFPHAIFQNGGWPEADYFVQSDEENASSHRFNLDSLVALLRATQENSVELYGVWSGGFVEEPRKRETASIDEFLDHRFCFKEGCFYEVRLR
jgi:hypothetical protein